MTLSDLRFTSVWLRYEMVARAARIECNTVNYSLVGQIIQEVIIVQAAL